MLVQNAFIFLLAYDMKIFLNWDDERNLINGHIGYSGWMWRCEDEEIITIMLTAKCSSSAY